VIISGEFPVIGDTRTGPYAPRAPNRVRLPRVWRAEARAKDQDALTHADLQSDLTRTTALSVAGLDESCRHCRPKRKGLRNRLPRAPPNQVWGTDDAECLVESQPGSAERAWSPARVRQGYTLSSLGQPMISGTSRKANDVLLVLNLPKHLGSD
jgi:hypothetical protein